MEALVTGGLEFIGSNIVRLLLENNIEVRVIDNLSSGCFVNILGYVSEERIEFVGGGIRDYKSVASSMDGVDVVFHLAAGIRRRRFIGNPQLNSETNMIGAISVLEAMRHAGTKWIVYSSSAAISGELTTSTVNEEHSQNADCQYEVSKLAAERTTLAYNGPYGFEGICLRYFNIYGISQCFDLYRNVIPIFAKRIFFREPITVFGDGGQTRDFPNVDDVVRTNYIATMSDVKSNVFNIGSGSSITINALAKVMQRVSGIDIGIHYAPEKVRGVKHCRTGADEIFNCLGCEAAVGLEEGLKKYIDWYRKNCV